MVYVLVDDKYHDLLQGGIVTRCGLDVPYGSEWISGWQNDDNAPAEKQLCKDCFPKDKKGK